MKNHLLLAQNLLLLLITTNTITIYCVSCTTSCIGKYRVHCRNHTNSSCYLDY